MPLNWQDASEIVCGKVIKGEYSSNAVRPEIFMPPYDDIVKTIKAGTIEIEDLIETCGLAPVQSALDAVKDINGLGEANWVALLERSYAQYEAGTKMEKMGRKLQRGEEIDWGQLKVYEQKALEGVGGDFVPLSKVEPKEVPFIDSGWSIIDEHLGGIPEVGLIVVGGDAGIGKTTFLAKAAQKFVLKHPDKVVAVFSLEMILSEIAMRFNEVEKLPAKAKERVLLNDFPVSVDEMANKAATIENLGLICVDFLDMMVKEASETEYSKVYLALANTAKKLHVPIMAAAQLIKTNGGIPKKRHLRYTKMAEALSWEIIMLYNPATDWGDDKDADDADLPNVEGRAYIICWKIRGGFRKHLDESPGAIQVAFRGDKGWGEKNSRWFSLRKV